MGTDKASLVVDGLAMQRRVELELERAGVGVVVVADSDTLPDPSPGVGEPESQGPMAGIVSGWRYLRSMASVYDPILVLSCDLPALTHEVISSLADAALQHAHGVAAHDGERVQPLIAAYRPQALDGIEAAFDAGGRSVRKCFEAWDLGRLTFDPARLADADTPDDLKGFHVEWPR